MPITLAHINEAIADAIPEREAIVTRDVRLSWRELQLRSRRLAHLLRAAGLGVRRAASPTTNGRAQPHLRISTSKWKSVVAQRPPRWYVRWTTEPKRGAYHERPSSYSNRSSNDHPALFSVHLWLCRHPG